MVKTLEKKAVRGVAKSKKATAKTRVASRPAKTFRKKSLEDSFVHFLQLTCPEQFTDGSKLPPTVEFIGSETFDSQEAESEILGETLLGTGLTRSVKVGKIPDLPSHLARLCETRLLEPEEEKSLFHRMNYLRYRAQQFRLEMEGEVLDAWTMRRIQGLLKAADWHRDLIVKSNMRLVISIVKKFVNTQNAFDDLLSEGIVALMRAVDKFDVGLGFRFSTYATQVVRRSTYRHVMDKQAERQRNICSIHENGVDVSDDQKESSMSESRWHELRARLSTMLEHLDRREKFIVRARFSLGGHRRVQTLQRLADKLGVSKERIRQLEKRALDKLRDMVELVPMPEIDA